jgi:hypothetical protein
VNRGEIAQFARRPLGSREVTLLELAGWALLLAFALVIVGEVIVTFHYRSYIDSNFGSGWGWSEYVLIGSDVWTAPWVLLGLAVVPGALKILAFRLETVEDPGVQFADSMSLAPEAVAAAIGLLGSIAVAVSAVVQLAEFGDASNSLFDSLFTRLGSIGLCALALWTYWRVYATPRDPPDEDLDADDEGSLTHPV